MNKEIILKIDEPGAVTNRDGSGRVIKLVAEDVIRLRDALLVELEQNEVNLRSVKLDVDALRSTYATMYGTQQQVLIKVDTNKKELDNLTNENQRLKGAILELRATVERLDKLSKRTFWGRIKDFFRNLF